MNNINKIDGRLLKTAYTLSIVTIIYNLIEGSSSIFFGFQDETLVLSAFGVDSFIKFISDVMIIVIKVTEPSALINETA